MTRNKTGNNKFLKNYNETGILDLIRTNMAVSRADLTKITGLSATAIGAIVASLQTKGYIHETGIGESKGGRKPVLLQLKPGSYYTIGIDADVSCLSFVLMDITGQTVFEAMSEIPSPCIFEDIAGMIAISVKSMLERFSIEEERLLGIGISVPGIVDSDSHVVVLAPNLGWENVDFRAELKGIFNTPVYVENEAMASAICENWLGACRDVNNFVCINIKSGIGAGIFTDGRLYRGAGGSAGEVGHIVVDENGPRCGCGNYGCLETMASTVMIVEKTRKMVRQGIDSSLNEVLEVEDIDIDYIVSAARNGDEAVKAILLESARFLGIALSSLVNTLNPSKIVIGKEFVKYGDLVMDGIKGIVSSKALKKPASNVEIVTSEIGEKASTLGAAIIPLKVLFGR
jgi:N-acetylglucosamine repressor